MRTALCTSWLLLTLGFSGCAAPVSHILFWQRPKIVAPAPAALRPGCHAERLTAQAMGTAITFLAWTDDSEKAQAGFRLAMAEIDRLERLMTTWPHAGWAPSEVMQLNAAAGHAAVAVGTDTYAVLASAICMGRLSEGLFDVTIGALDDLWHFHQDLTPEVPRPEAIAARLARVDYRDLVLDPEHHTARLRRPGMAVNLGGIAKGYAVDKAVNVLHAAGVEDVVVQAGGDLYASGQRGTKPWRIGIRDPRGLLVEDVLAHVAVHDQAVSTAGDYERGFEVQGRRYHHILDPHTGEPSALCQSVTILAPSAWLADAIDDVVFLKGPKAGLDWIKQFAGVEAVVVDSAGHMVVSEGLKHSIDCAGSAAQTLEPTPPP